MCFNMFFSKKVDNYLDMSMDVNILDFKQEFLS